MTIRNVVFATVAAVFAAGSAWSVEKTETSIALQAAMQRHIDRSVIDGAILDLDPATGEIRKLFPTKAHPMIVRAENFFVLCADLRDEAGQRFEVDYYLAQTPRGFRVFMTEIDNRQVLKDMMKAGLAEPY
jgi:hypothetical protein